MPSKVSNSSGALSGVNNHGFLSTVQGFQNEDGSFPPRRIRLQKLSMFQNPFPLSETSLENGRYMEQLKARSGGPRKISNRMAWDMVREARKNPCITAKELQKRVAITGLAVHRTRIQHTLRNKGLHGRVVRKNNLNTKLSFWSCHGFSRFARFDWLIPMVDLSNFSCAPRQGFTFFSPVLLPGRYFSTFLPLLGATSSFCVRTSAKLALCL